MSICMIYPFIFAAEVAASVTFRHYWETKIEPVVFAVKLRAEELQSDLSGTSHLSLTLFVRESKHYLIIMLYTPRERGAYMFSLRPGRTPYFNTFSTLTLRMHNILFLYVVRQ